MTIGIRQTKFCKYYLENIYVYVFYIHFIESNILHVICIDGWMRCLYMCSRKLRAYGTGWCAPQNDLGMPESPITYSDYVVRRVPEKP